MNTDTPNTPANSGLLERYFKLTEPGTTVRTAIAKSQYEQRRAQNGTWTYTWR